MSYEMTGFSFIGIAIYALAAMFSDTLSFDWKLSLIWLISVTIIDTIIYIAEHIRT